MSSSDDAAEPMSIRHNPREQGDLVEDLPLEQGRQPNAFSLTEDLQPVPDKFTPPQTPFNHEKWREITRAALAFLLTTLLGAVILIFVIAGINSYPAAEAKEYLALILSPLVGIVGAATGFYYAGGKDSK